MHVLFYIFYYSPRVSVKKVSNKLGKTIFKSLFYSITTFVHMLDMDFTKLNQRGQMTSIKSHKKVSDLEKDQLYKISGY